MILPVGDSGWGEKLPGGTAQNGTGLLDTGQLFAELIWSPVVVTVQKSHIFSLHQLYTPFAGTSGSQIGIIFEIADARIALVASRGRIQRIRGVIIDDNDFQWNLLRKGRVDAAANTVGATVGRNDDGNQWLLHILHQLSFFLVGFVCRDGVDLPVFDSLGVVSDKQNF